MIAAKRMQTIMIGALASIEKYFGDLWGQNEDGELTEQQKKFDELYEFLRTEILDKGNHQIRLFNDDLENYDVDMLVYEFVLKKE